MKSSFRSGFTLIELLVVIAIIAMLAAILFPVFASARDKARQAACLSNLKQLGLAISQYEQDYEEITPNGNYKFSASGGWASQIFPYVKNAAMFKCPDDKTKGNSSSFGYNSNFGTGGNLSAATPVPNTSISLAKLTAPSKTVLLFEVQGNYVDYFDITFPYEQTFGGNVNFNSSPFGNGVSKDYSPSGAGTFMTACGSQALQETLKYATGYLGGYTPSSPNAACHVASPTGLHQDGSNFLLADNHVKWMRGASVSPGANANTENNAQVNNSNAAGTAVSTFGATFSIR